MQLKEGTPEMTQEFHEVSAVMGGGVDNVSATSSSSSSVAASSSLSSFPVTLPSILRTLESTSASLASSSAASLSSSSTFFPSAPSNPPLSSMLSEDNRPQRAPSLSTPPPISSSSSSSSLPLSSYSKFLSQKPMTSSRNINICLFGPTDTQQNKKDFDKLMRGMTRNFDPTGVDLTRDDLGLARRTVSPCLLSDSGIKKFLIARAQTPLETLTGNLSPMTKRRRTEGQLPYPRKKKTTIFALREIDGDADDTVWRSPKKFGSAAGIVRLVPKTTPLRRLFDEEVAEVGVESNLKSESRLGENTADCPTTKMARYDVDVSLRRQSSIDIAQESALVARRVPVVQLRPQRLRQRRGSQSNPNLKQSVLEDAGAPLRRRRSFSQLCSSLEKISTFDHNNNNNNNDGDDDDDDNNNDDNNDNDDEIVGRSPLHPDSRFCANFNQFSDDNNPSRIVAPGDEKHPSGNATCPSFLLEADTIDPIDAQDSSVDDPYLRLIRERESLGFVPINRLCFRDETSESMEEA